MKRILSSFGRTLRQTYLVRGRVVAEPDVSVDAEDLGQVWSY